MDNGIRIINMDGEFTFGFNQRDKGNISGIATKETGQMELEMDMVYFIMQMELSIKDIGRII